MGPEIDLNKIPLGHPGVSTNLIQPNGANPEPSGDGVGAFRVSCKFSHMNFDDPIVYPGQVGRSHLHTFFGNTSLNANSTADSIALGGNSTCSGGTANRSGYWIPSLIDTRDGTPLPPLLAVFYYKSGYLGVNPQNIIDLPRGLRMIAGYPNANNAQDAWEIGVWNCGTLHSSDKKSIPADCPAGSTLEVHIDFPQCWNGNDLDSPNHRSHMAFATGNGCPTTHPRAIPVITFNISWLVPESNATAHWRLSSDMYTDGAGGYSMHGDWFNGWDQRVTEQWMTHCVRPPGNCSNAIGNGDVLGD